MLVQRPKNRIGYADVADLKADPVVTFQHKHYPYFALIMGFLFPMFVAGLGWGDFRVSFLVFFFYPKFWPRSRPILTTIALYSGRFLLRWRASSLLCPPRYLLRQQLGPLPR